MLKPIYLIASERSGTNLLRRRFTDNQEVYFGPSPAHFLKHLYGKACYQGLRDDRVFVQLIEDALGLAYIHFSPWEIKLKASDVVREYDKVNGERSIVLLADFLMKTYAQFKGYQSYFCKDNHLFNYATAIQQEIPEAFFIYLYRDPRDFTLSQLKRPYTSDSTLKFAEMWKKEQVAALRALSGVKEENKFQLSYESFLSDEGSVLQALGEKLGIQMNREGGSAEKDLGKSIEWENLNKATMQGNFNKYKKEMSQKQIRMIEATCWEQMQSLGYTCENEKLPNLSIIEKKLDRLKGGFSATRRKKKLNKSKDEYWKMRTERYRYLAALKKRQGA